MDKNELIGCIEGFVDFMRVWDIVKNNPVNVNKMIVCTLIDSVAGQEDRTGYEMM